MENFTFRILQPLADGVKTSIIGKVAVLGEWI